MPLEVFLVDKNMTGIQGVVDSMSLCRNNDCTFESLKKAMEAKPHPHLSLLENLWYKFLITGLSVKARIQLERHRLFSSTERSTRHINMSNAEFVVPPTALCQQSFDEAYPIIRQLYIQALEGERAAGNPNPEETASYLLPLGVTTRFTLAGNGRTWFEYLQKRLCHKYVQAEHYILATEIHRLLMEETSLFGYAKPCLSCGKCKGVFKNV